MASTDSTFKEIQTQIEVLAEQVGKLEGERKQEIQKELLQTLYELRDTFHKDLEEFKLPPVETKVSKPVEDIDKKIDQLQLDNTKLNYRIIHLTRNVKELLDTPEKNELLAENARLKCKVEDLVNKNKELLK